MNDLEAKTALITGAASGMGRAFALRFARAGMNVVLADVEEPALAEAAEEVAATGVATMTGVVDVADADAVDALARAAIDRFGRVHLVCNNAGVAGSDLAQGPGHIHLENWHWVMGVNFWGVVHGHRSFLPHLLEHGEGHIVNTASMAGHLPMHSSYGASKWAVVGISEGLRGSLQGTGVGVSCLCPGWVRTAIGHSARNRPEWAAPDALDQPAPEGEAAMDQIREFIDAGMDPAQVADLVHDAVVEDRFWIFPHPDMVDRLQTRFDHVLAGTNPEPLSVLNLDAD